MAVKDNSIEKALDVLTAFIPNNDARGTFEISRLLGFNKSTASRILLTLTRRGFLQQDASTKKFKLGRSSLNLWRAVTHSLMTPFVQLAKPYIDELRTKIGTTIVLEQIVNQKPLIVHVSEGPQRVKVAGDAGDQVLIHAAAGAKAMLAFSDPAHVAKIIDQNPDFKSMTPSTITSRERFINHLHEIRRQGYSIDNEEIDSGIKAIGMPIFDSQGVPIASLAVVFPAHRLAGNGDPDLLARIRRTTETISRRWLDKEKIIKQMYEGLQDGSDTQSRQPCEIVRQC